jgi:hypothetical protein
MGLVASTVRREKDVARNVGDTWVTRPILPLMSREANRTGMLRTGRAWEPAFLAAPTRQEQARRPDPLRKLFLPSVLNHLRPSPRLPASVISGGHCPTTRQGRPSLFSEKRFIPDFVARPIHRVRAPRTCHFEGAPQGTGRITRPCARPRNLLSTAWWPIARPGPSPVRPSRGRHFGAGCRVGPHPIRHRISRPCDLCRTGRDRVAGPRNDIRLP